VDFGFSYEIEPELFEKIPSIRNLERQVAAKLSGSEIGAGVKDVTVGIVAVNPARAGRYPLRKPKYRPGKYLSKELGVPLEFEDTLAFDIKTSVEELRRATTEAELASVIRRAVGFVFPTLLELKIPDFDAQVFVETLDEILRELGTH
jgi:hypothetical protein